MSKAVLVLTAAANTRNDEEERKKMRKRKKLMRKETVTRRMTMTRMTKRAVMKAFLGVANGKRYVDQSYTGAPSTLTWSLALTQTCLQTSSSPSLKARVMMKRVREEHSTMFVWIDVIETSTTRIWRG